LATVSATAGVLRVLRARAVAAAVTGAAGKALSTTAAAGVTGLAAVVAAELLGLAAGFGAAFAGACLVLVMATLPIKTVCVV